MDLSVVGLFMLVLVGHGVCLDDLCQESRCSKDGPAIRFPFKLKDGPSLDDQCGYPGFDLSCTNKKETLLQLPNSVKLYVNEINYALQFIIASDPECLQKQLRNFSLSGSPFESRYKGQSDYAFFNCTSYKGDGYTHLDCLSGPGYDIYAYESDYSISYTDLTNCTKLYNLSSVPSEFFGLKSILLSWSMPGCQQCEQQGKFCKLKKNSTASLETECYDKPKSKKGKGGVSTVLIIAIVIPVSVSLVLFYLGFCFLCSRAKSNKYSAQENDVANEITTVESLQFDLSSIEDATNHFSSDNKLGEGGFGAVYKGTLPNGQAIAVKRLSKGSEQGAAEFKNEVILVAKLQHRNLVRLLGFCLEGEEKILVYEYVPNKSLDYFLFDPEKQGLLDWSKRYRIIKGIARGILYLHEDSRLRVIHRDLKVSNILLDGDMNAKVSDFGMARIFGVDQTQGSTNRIVGTYGYMSPEYAMHGQFSVKSDAYSFGVLILEIISGKKNRSFNQTGGAADLVNYVWKHWRDGTSLEVMDPTLTDTYSRSEIIRCIHIGLLCVQEDPASRPTMTTIVLVLNSYLITLPSPHEPAFCIHSRTDQGSIPSNGFFADQSKSNFVPYSVDDGSITEVYPR